MVRGVTTQRTQPSIDDPTVATSDITGPVVSDKVGREAFGLLLLSSGPIPTLPLPQAPLTACVLFRDV